MEESEIWVEYMIENPCNGKFDFVITLRPPTTDVGEAEHRVVGKIGISELTLPSSDIGIMIDPVHQGKGIATEALKAVLEYLWKAVEGLEEITADVDPRNDASLKLLKKHGFQVTGEAKGTFQTEDGQCWDSVYLSLKRSSSFANGF